MSFRQMFRWTIVSGAFLACAAICYAEKSHDGKVVSVTETAGTKDGKLVMADKDGKNEHSHAIASSVKVTRNGKNVKLGDLKKGDAVSVTTADDGKVTALAAKESSAAESAQVNSDSSQTEPDMLKNLKLSSDQQAKVNEIMKKYDGEFDATWKEFSNSYQRAIRLEASMLAAIEEHFSDGQRKQLRDQRHRMAHHKHHDGKDKVKVTTDAPKNVVEEEIVVIGVTLTPEQQEKAHGVRRHFGDRISSLNDDIDRLHSKLISLETEKLEEIEGVLTKEQRDQLRKDHQSLTSKTGESSDKTTTK